MKRSLWFLCITLALFLPTKGAGSVTELKRDGHVSDFAHILSSSIESSINHDLSQLLQKGGPDVAVVTVPSLEGKDVNLYAIQLGVLWEVGWRNTHGGVMFVVAPTDRKMSIRTDTKSRLWLSDQKAQQIIDRGVIPFFKTGDMPIGINTGVRSIIDLFWSSSVTAVPPVFVPKAEVPRPQAPRFETTSAQNPNTEKSSKALLWSILLIAPIALLLILFISRQKRRKEEELRIEEERVPRTLRDKIRQDYSRPVPRQTTPTTLKKASEEDVKARLVEVKGRIEKLEENVRTNGASTPSRRHVQAARAKYEEAEGIFGMGGAVDTFLLMTMLSHSEASCRSAEYVPPTRVEAPSRNSFDSHATSRASSVSSEPSRSYERDYTPSHTPPTPSYEPSYTPSPDPTPSSFESGGGGSSSW